VLRVSFTFTTDGITCAFPKGAALGDYDGDGDLDVFTAQSNDILWRNDGGVSFTQVGAGVITGSGGLGGHWADFDDDTNLDLFVSHSGTNRFYEHNGGDVFQETASVKGVTGSGIQRGAAWGDVNNDGWADLYVASSASDFLFLNSGPPNFTFSDISGAAGINSPSTINSGGVAWVDFDNDGDLDIFVTNIGGADRLFRNNGNSTFTDTASVSGVADAGASYRVAVTDINGDGSPDFYVTTSGQDLLYKSSGTVNNYIKVKAMTDTDGDATNAGDGQPDRSALGAFIEVDINGGANFDTGIGAIAFSLVGASDGFGQSSMTEVVIGIGSATSVTVNVVFQDGSESVTVGVAAGSSITVLDPP